MRVRKRTIWGLTAITTNDLQLTEYINLLRNRPAHEMLFVSHTP